ncbi:MAG: restriction endonuclease [Chloroflexi bacterium]|nr:restriction endonuclease [Chloroflexota bacterium]
MDHLGTSRQALELALSLFDATFVTHLPSARQVTFHPKLYIFFGNERGVCLLGSHNLTVGGTETNFEVSVRIEFDRTIEQDEASFQEVLACWTCLLPDQCPATHRLDPNTLGDYVRRGLLFDETPSPHSERSVRRGVADAPRSHATALWRLKPASSVPRETTATLRARPSSTVQPQPVHAATGEALAPGNTLVIQIVPHHNGEVFLSKIAVDENPTFFGFPFGGRTTPKRSGNPSYPQREPDPVVNIIIHDANGAEVPSLRKQGFKLNTVYYERKSEIRITLSPGLARMIPRYSVLVMRVNTGEEPQDYDIEIFMPGSDQFRDYLAVCNQELPSGGAEAPRNAAENWQYAETREFCPH